MSQFMACHETQYSAPPLDPIGEVAKVEPQDPARAVLAPTTITLKSGEQVHAMERKAMVRSMAYNPLWMIDA